MCGWLEKVLYGEINVREYRRGNQERTIQRNWQHWAHKKQDEDKQKNTTQKTKKMSNRGAHIMKISSQIGPKSNRPQNQSQIGPKK